MSGSSLTLIELMGIPCTNLATVENKSVILVAELPVAKEDPYLCRDGDFVMSYAIIMYCNGRYEMLACLN